MLQDTLQTQVTNDKTSSDITPQPAAVTGSRHASFGALIVSNICTVAAVVVVLTLVFSGVYPSASLGMADDDDNLLAGAYALYNPMPFPQNEDMLREMSARLETEMAQNAMQLSHIEPAAGAPDATQDAPRRLTIHGGQMIEVKSAAAMTAEILRP